MNITEAWAIGYSGRGIKIAILDNGLQTNHSDLDSNVVCIFLVYNFHVINVPVVIMSYNIYTGNIPYINFLFSIVNKSYDLHIIMLSSCEL